MSRCPCSLDCLHCHCSQQVMTAIHLRHPFLIFVVRLEQLMMNEIHQIMLIGDSAFSLTFFFHTHLNTFLVTTVLATIALPFIDDTISIISTCVCQVFAHRTFEETFTSFATRREEREKATEDEHFQSSGKRNLPVNTIMFA